ncbi:hypothetical protein BST61_g5084 [Cercospora zeina]
MALRILHLLRNSHFCFVLSSQSTTRAGTTARGCTSTRTTCRSLLPRRTRCRCLFPPESAAAQSINVTPWTLCPNVVQHLATPFNVHMNKPKGK